ncbi:hypothetical protein BGW42_005177 [Actinomortierella wolfii]|nr:hypothetical protein BGW42_005177 [Actinomortierella wolfii]
MPFIPPSGQDDELALETAALKEELEWFMSTQAMPSLKEIHRALLELVVKLPKQPVVKAAIYAQVPSNMGGTSAAESAAATGVAALSAPAATATTAETTMATSTTASTASHPNSSVHPGRKSPPSTSLSMAAAPAAELSNIQGSHQLLQDAIVAGTSSNASASSSSASVKAATGAHGRGSSTSSVASSGSGTVGTVTTMTAMNPTGGSVGLTPHQLLNPYKAPGFWTQPYFLEQVKDIQNHLSQALFHLDDFWALASSCSSASQQQQQPASSSLSSPSVETSPPPPIELSAVQTLLQLLQRHLRGAIENLARPSKEKLYPFRVCDPKIFAPPLNEDFILEFYIRDSKVVCAAYALQLSTPPPSVSGGSALYHPQPQHYYQSDAQQSHSHQHHHHHQQQQHHHSLQVLQPPPPAATTGSGPVFLGHSHQRAYSQPSVTQSLTMRADGATAGAMTDFAASGPRNGNTNSSQTRPAPRRSPSSSYFTGGKPNDQGAGGGGSGSMLGFSWSSPSKSPPPSLHVQQPSTSSSKNGGVGGGGVGTNGGHGGHHGSGTTTAATATAQSKTSGGGTNYLSMLSGVRGSDGSAPLALDKIGLTTKGGINKYRGKIATTLEDVMVQVQHPKLDDMRSRLVHAEALCLNLSTRLQVFVQ